MAPAHIATPGEIGGSNGTDELYVYHTQGPFKGMALLNKKNDASLPPAIAAKEIITEGDLAAAPPAVPTPTITSITPGTGTLASLKPGPTALTIAGTGFVDGTTTVTVKSVAVSSITVTSPTSLVFDADLSGETAAGNVPVVVTNGAGKTATRNFVVTA